MKRIPLFKTVSRRDAGAEPTWMYLRHVLNKGILFIYPVINVSNYSIHNKISC